MYVALQIAAALSSMRTVLAFTSAKLSRILKSKSVELGTISDTSELLPAGHQIGEAELLFIKLKMKKFRNK
jgi:methionyl-tRNA synthetase